MYRHCVRASGLVLLLSIVALVGLSAAEARSATALQGVDLGGTVWVGTELGREVGFVFDANGTVAALDDRLWGGTWETVGNTVVIRLTRPGRVTYVGTINGNKIVGQASQGGNTWTFRLTER